MRVERQNAFVLHQREYSESSLLVELFTREHGRVGVIAKGARRPRSGRRGLLAPFLPLLVGWSGKGELGVLTGVEATDLAIDLAGQAVYCGFYVNELVMRLVHRHDPHEGLFDVYDICLRELRNDPDVERTLRRFEYRLLQELGYGLVLDRDVANNMFIDPGSLYCYVPDEGPHLVASVGQSPTMAYVHGRTLLALARGEFDDTDVLVELKGLMRALIAHRLDYKPLQSRRIFAGRSRSPAAGNNGDRE